MIFLKSKAGRRCEVMTGKTPTPDAAVNTNRKRPTAERFDSSVGTKNKTLTAWVKVGHINSVNKGNGRVSALPESPKQKRKMDMKAMMRIAFAVAMLALVAVIVVMVVRTWWAQGGQNIGQLVAALVFYGAGGFAIWYTGDSALRKEK